MKVPITIQKLGHRQTNDAPSDSLIPTYTSKTGTVRNVKKHEFQAPIIVISLAGLGTLCVVGLSALNNYSFSHIKSTSHISNSATVLPPIVTQDIATLRSPLTITTTTIPSTNSSTQTNYSVNGTGNVTTEVEASSSDGHNSSMNVTINGQAIPSTQDNNSEHTTVISQPDGNAIMKVTSTDASNGSSNNFSNSDEDMSTDNSSVSYDQEGQ